MPGTSWCRNSAWRELCSGSTPSSSGTGKPPRPEPPAGLGVHRLDLLDREEGLCQHDVGARPELAFQPIPLRVGVGRGRIERTRDGERRVVSDWRSGGVFAPIEAIEDLDEADRIDVPDAGRRGVVADPWRIAGQRQDVPHPEGMGAEQLRFERHQVSVARREVDQALEIEIVLDREGHGHAAHPDTRHGRVADVDDVDAGGLEQTGGLHRALDSNGPRRIDLDRDDESDRTPGPRRGGSAAMDPSPSDGRPGSRGSRQPGRGQSLRH